MQRYQEQMGETWGEAIFPESRQMQGDPLTCLYCLLVPVVYFTEINSLWRNSQHTVLNYLQTSSKSLY